MTERDITPTRIKEARISKAMSRQDLAVQIGLTCQAINQYENGVRSPSCDVLNALSHELEVPLAFFTTAKRKEIQNRGPLFFRALKTIRSEKHKARYEVLTKWLVEIREWLEDSIDFPALSLPENEAKQSNTQEEIEARAAVLRKHWGLGNGPIRKLTALIESSGITVFKIDTDDIATDAFSGYLDGKPYIFANRCKNDVARSRFDLAHELGHILLHSHLSSEEEIAADLANIEHEADLFAGAFLLPQETFALEVLDTTLSGFRRLKQRWGVSVQAMIMRSWQLNIINEHRKTELYRQLSAKGWRKNEPDSEFIEKDDSSVCKKAFDLLIEHDAFMFDRLHDDQQIPRYLLADTFGIENNKIEFRPKLRLSV